jgi:riboflavin-specific deaminase-like protein
MELGYPYVHINFACSLDGKIAMPDGKPYKFSSFEDMVRVHKLRSEVDAILVGKNTIKNDDPKLTINPKYYNSDKIPKAIILDSKLELSKDYRVFNFNREVIIFTTVSEVKDIDGNIRYVSSKGNPLTIDFILKKSKELGIHKILVEGGKTVISNFLKSNLWDILTIYYSPILIGENGINFYGEGLLKLDDIKVENFSDGFLLTAVNVNKSQ